MPPSLQPSMRPEPAVSREHLLELGHEAATLLSAPIFNTAYRETMNGIYEQWTLEVNPAKREELWLQVQNLAEVTRQLLTHVNAAQNVSLTAEEEAEADLNRYEDEQGFI